MACTIVSKTISKITECERGWHGFNCSKKCKCKRGQKCHRVEGCIDKHKCKEDECDDDGISTAKSGTDL